MPPAAQRLQHLLLILNQGAMPAWDEVTRLWIDSLLEFDGMPEEHVLDRLGGPLHRRDRNALAQDIERTLRFLANRTSDTSVTVTWS
jgi:hypothetical protein